MCLAENSQLRILLGARAKQVAEYLRISESKVSRAIAMLKYPDIYEHVKAGSLTARKAHELAGIFQPRFPAVFKRCDALGVAHRDIHVVARDFGVARTLERYGLVQEFSSVSLLALIHHPLPACSFS